MLNILLYLVSQILGLILFPIGILYGILRSFWQVRWKNGIKRVSDKFLHLAKSFDKYGNVVCKELFNDMLITKNSKHYFGRIEETISMVIGYNLQEGTLSKTGRILNSILDFIDKNHSIKAIELDKK